MEIREALPGDAETLIAMFKLLDSETTFLLYEPQERDQSVEAQMSRLDEVARSKRDLFLIATDQSGVLGFCAGWGGHVRRNTHRLEIIIGVTQKYVGQGIGRQLLEKMESWALSNRFVRLELTVMVHNPRAISLYESVGFLVEGTRQHSLKVDGVFVDEYLMAKLI